MSAVEDNTGNNEDENMQLSEDAGNIKKGSVSEDNVPSLDSNISSGIIGAISESQPQPNITLKESNRESGDGTGEVFSENTVPSHIPETQMAEELVNTDPSNGSGHYLAKTQVNNEDTKKVNDNNDNLNEAITSISHFNIKQHDRNDSLCNRCDNIELNKGDTVDIVDDDMELRWEDDDDGNNQVMMDNNQKPYTDTINLSEEQLLDDADINSEISGNEERDRDIFTENSEENNKVIMGDIYSKEIENCPATSEISSVMDISVEKSVDIIVTGGALLEDTEINTKSTENCSNIDSPVEKTINKKIDCIIEDKLLENTIINTETLEINPEVEISVGKKEESQYEDILLENILLTGTDYNARTAIEKEEYNGTVLEQNLLEEIIDESSELIPKIEVSMNECLNKIEVIPEISKVVPETDVSNEIKNEVVLVDKLVEENKAIAEPSEVILARDVSIDGVSNEKVESVRSDQPQNDMCTALDVCDSSNIVKAIEQTSINMTTICEEDSPIPIRSDHALQKPDVMLEIPTQELIDIDDEDVFMNIDQSKVIYSPDDGGNVLGEDRINEKTDGQEGVTTEPEHRVIRDQTNDKNIVKEEKIKNVEKISSFLQETIEESLEKMFAEDELTAVKEVAACKATTSQTSDVLSSTSATKITSDKSEFVSPITLAVTTQDEQHSTLMNENTPEPLDQVPEIVQATTRQDPAAQSLTSLDNMGPDTSDEVPDISDSLGLLAESSRRMVEEDEDQDDDDDDGDEDDDFEDESSNQISAEQSEDSNAPHSETEPVKYLDGNEIDLPEIKEETVAFAVRNIEGLTQEAVQFKGDIEIVEEIDVKLQEESVHEETKSAVDALLKDGSSEVIEDAVVPQVATVFNVVDTADREAEDKIEVGTTPDEDQAPEQSKETEEDTTKLSPSEELASPSPVKRTPSKLRELLLTTITDNSIVNIVDLEESSSSEDDIQEVEKQPELEITPEDEPISLSVSPDPQAVTNVNIPSSIEIMCTSGGTTSEMVTKEGEVVISGIPKPPPHKPARLNTSEVSIKTASNAEPLVIPETKMNGESQSNAQAKPKLSLEIFTLDSDEDDAVKETPTTASPHKMTALELEKARETSKCINYCCTSDSKECYRVADAATVAYYDAGRKRRAMVCQPCAEVVANRTKNLIKGIKDKTPLIDLDMGKLSEDLVEISDSESEDEVMTPEEPKECIGEKGAKLLEENLAQLLNETWLKYDMDTRLKETQLILEDEIEKLNKDSKEIGAMLDECQIATDKLRCELYATFEHRRQEVPALCIYDTPEQDFIGPEAYSGPPLADSAEARHTKRRISPTRETPAKRPAIPLGYTPLSADTSSTKTRQAKRRLSSTSEAPAKRPPIPLGYAPLRADNSNEEPKPVAVNKLEDDKDISVVKLSAEAAPADLPPPGEISRPPLRVSMSVFAMKNAFGPWLKGKILEIQPKSVSGGTPFTLCRVKFDHKTKTNGKILPARCIAYAEPADVRMTIGTRLIALFKDSNKRESYYSGVVAEIPNPVNSYRYLVFFDDGYAQYVQHAYTRIVCESSPLVWEEVHPFSREFVREYLLAYPERPMVRLHEGQSLKTEWNGKWWSSQVTRVDASLAQVLFSGDGRREWIYRGSTRLAPLYLELRAAERHRPRPMPRSKAQPKLNTPYVEYTRSDEPDSNKQQGAQPQQQSEDIRRQRAVAKKSTSLPPVIPPPQPAAPGNLDTVTSRVVYYTPKNAVKPYKMAPHRCSPKCKRNDLLSLKELRTYNPLAKPLLSGWERQIVRFKGHKEVMYRAPCGRRLRSLRELHHYLRAVDSELPVDLFDFHHGTHCLAEFVLNKCLVGKKDLSHGKENVPVPCVNYYDDSLPEFCSYNTERTPTAGVPLNLDPEFLCGCDCTDDCQDKSKCACWRMTLEGARTIGLNVPSVGYVYKRLPEPLPSGIYECNSRCKCKHTCLNRVAQHPLQLKLQVFKTLNRGWGIRALNDVPKGSFLCVYAGNLLTDATANLDGLNEGDEYLAELDYIEVVEQMKEGYEEDIPELDKKLDKKERVNNNDDNEEDEPSSSDNEETTDKGDDDFRPGSIGLGVMEFSKRLRRREKLRKEKQVEARNAKEKEDEKEKEKETKEHNAEDDCITISDDEEVREPSRFTVQAGMGASEFISKYKSVRTLFGMDEACYIMDAKVQGNIGRYLNHSCCPNVFVQNVFVDTHDPRFPWVAFFALSHIRAGTELTWNYNYDVGSVPGKVLYCYCGAPNCRGRLL